MPDGQVLEFTRVTKRFNDVTAVSDFSARVEPGVVTAFLGPNGAGKTTTLRILLGQVRPTSGTATIGGTAFAELRHPLRTIGSVLEETVYRPRRTATRQLTIAAKANGIPLSRVDEVLSLVGLENEGEGRIGSFSLGMRQRLSVAHALLGDPGALVFDEPANGLDPEGIRWMRLLMRRLADEGRTVLVSSHVLSEVEQVADNVLVLSKGQLVLSSGIEQLADPSSGSVVVDAADRAALRTALADAGFDVEVLRSGLTVRGGDAKTVGGVAAAAGIALSTLVQRGPTLEDVFIELVRGGTLAPQAEAAAAQLVHPEVAEAPGGEVSGEIPLEAPLDAPLEAEAVPGDPIAAAALTAGVGAAIADSDVDAVDETDVVETDAVETDAIDETGVRSEDAGAREGEAAEPEAAESEAAESEAAESEATADEDVDTELADDAEEPADVDAVEGFDGDAAEAEVGESDDDARAAGTDASEGDAAEGETTASDASETTEAEAVEDGAVDQEDVPGDLSGDEDPAFESEATEGASDAVETEAGDDASEAADEAASVDAAADDAEASDDMSSAGDAVIDDAETPDAETPDAETTPLLPFAESETKPEDDAEEEVPAPPLSSLFATRAAAREAEQERAAESSDEPAEAPSFDDILFGTAAPAASEPLSLSETAADESEADESEAADQDANQETPEAEDAAEGASEEDASEEHSSDEEHSGVEFFEDLHESDDEAAEQAEEPEESEGAPEEDVDPRSAAVSSMLAAAARAYYEDEPKDYPFGTPATATDESGEDESEPATADGAHWSVASTGIIDTVPGSDSSENAQDADATEQSEGGEDAEGDADAQSAEGHEGEHEHHEGEHEHHGEHHDHHDGHQHG